MGGGRVLHEHARAKTLFATHYHELTELEEVLDSVKNYHVSVKETGGSIVFLAQGLAGRGRQELRHRSGQARRAAHEVISRAREVLANMNLQSGEASGHLGKADGKEASPVQLTIFTPLSSGVIEKLRESDSPPHHSDCSPEPAARAETADRVGFAVRARSC